MTLVETRQAWLTHVKGPRLLPELTTPVTGVDCLNKPGRAAHKGCGLWTSTYLGPGRISGWAEWCGPEEFGGPDWQVFLLTPEPDVRLWEINAHADLLALMERYGVEGEIFRCLGRHSMFPEMDFDRFTADGYAGVHLTEAGEHRTRWGMLNGECDPSLYGWDCESTLWCRWAFTDVEDLGVMTWEGSGDDDA